MILAIDLMDETNEVTEEAQQLVESILQFAAKKKRSKKILSCQLHLWTMREFVKSIRSTVIKMQPLMSFPLHLKKWVKMKSRLLRGNAPHVRRYHHFHRADERAG